MRWRGSWRNCGDVARTVSGPLRGRLRLDQQCPRTLDITADTPSQQLAQDPIRPRREELRTVAVNVVTSKRDDILTEMAQSVLPTGGMVSAHVDATPEQLWTYISDPTVPAKFSAELIEAAFLGSDVPELGAVISGRNARGDFEWSTLSTVVAIEKPYLFQWATGDEHDPTATWTFEVEPDDDGSFLTHRVTLHAGKAPLGPAIEREPDRAEEIVDARMAEVLSNMEATIKGIASLASRDVAR